MRARHLLLNGALLLAVLVFGLGIGCREEPTAPTAPVGVLATVGERVITENDLAAEATRRRKAGRPVPPKDALLEELVTAEALFQSAEEAGVGDDPEVRRSIRALLIGHLKQRELTPQLEALEVDEESILKAYEERREAKYTRPGRLQIAIVYLKGSPADDTLKARAEAAAKLARSSPDGFVQAAVKYSDHQASRYRGGVVGFLLPEKPPAGVPPEIATAADKLKTEGEIAGPLEHESGYYLVKLMRRVPATVVPITQVRDQLRTELLSTRRQEATREFEERLRAERGISIDRKALDAVVLPGGTTTEDPPPAAPR